MRYPVAPTDDVVDVLHGVEVADPYRWLEDDRSPRTTAWCAAQDELCRSHLDGLSGRDGVRSALRALARVGAVSAPAIRRGRLFFLRREGDQEHAILYVREPDGTERVLIDPAALSEDATTTLDFVSPSRDGLLLAYGLSEAGDEEAVLRVMDVGTGEDLGERIDRVRYSPVAWLPDASGFYYVRRLPPGRVPEGEEQFHRRVYLHRLGADPDTDTEIFGGGRDHRSYYGVSLSRDGRWLVVYAIVGTDSRNDLYVADLRGDAAFAPVVEGEDALSYASVAWDGRLYVTTNLDAPRWRLAVADPARPMDWRELIPESDDVFEGAAVTRAGLVAAYTRDVATRIVVHDLDTGAVVREIELPAMGSAGVTSDPDGGDDAFIPFTSFATPSQVYRCDVASGRLELWAMAPGEIDGNAYTVEQVFCASRDGTRIPMFVIRRTDTPVDGTAPGLLTGYGGFNASLTPYFLGTYLHWVDRGGVFAIANLRGGSEYGEEWHRAGMLGNKQNVFDDFVAAGEYLVAEGYVAGGCLAIHGGSNGGLLVGAAVTQRPDLYRAVVCSAPLLDMVRYERFGLGSTWNVEYGSADEPDAFRWLHAYSPYHRVQDDVSYPAVLFETFESDTRVHPLHARKMCARMQAATVGERPILIRRETKVGHAARSVSRAIETQVDTLSFLFHELGVEPEHAGARRG
jgi:prolyl oligopeptidase